ncbi:MAG TPA: T9SS type A sorting domain-containing protein, partial [Bacteroidia bacterium]|nr:T9SS type A sorting domain-containing protein [Bacteroidia bacterium]
ATPSVISGASSAVCAGTTGTYSVTNVAGVTYNWTAPANASIATGQGTNSVSVSFSALFTSGSLTVSGSNACGTSALRTLSISSKPATPGTITGPGFGNCNATATYSIVAVAYATSYTWTTNIAGAVVTPSGTSASISFPAFTSGTVSVTANNTCGSSAAKTLTVKGTPATPASITGPTLVCANQFGVPYSIAAIPTATSYTWTGMTGSHISDGVVTSSGTTLTTTSTSVTVNFGSTSGNLNVKANNACGAGTNKTLTIGFNCREEEADNNNFDVTVYPNPSSGDFVFEISNAGNEKISVNIYDVIGKLVLSEAIHNSQFTIGNPQLTPGIYSAEIICGENKKVMRLVKTE